MQRRGLLLSLLLGTCGFAFGQVKVYLPEDADAQQQSLVAAQSAVYEAYQKKDAGTLEKALSPDFVNVGTSGDTSDRKDVLQDLKESDITGITLYNFEFVSLSSGAAVLTFDAVFRQPKNDFGARRYQHVSTAWAKQAGAWKLTFQQATPNLWSALDTD